MALADLKDERGLGRVSLWLLALLGLIGATVVLAVLAARHDWARTVQRWHVQLEAISGTQSSAIERWILERMNDLRVIADIPTVATLARVPETTSSNQSLHQKLRTEVEMMFASVIRNEGYVSALLIAADGRILAAVGQNLELDRASLELPERCLAERRPLTDFRLHRGTTPVVEFAGPVFTDRAAAPVAVVLLTSGPENWLYPFLRHQPVPSDTGETVLVRKDGDDALVLSPLRYRVDPPLTLRRRLSTRGFTAEAALQGRQVFSEYADSNDERVLAVTRLLKDTPWAMVVKVDRAEVLREYWRGLVETVAILTGFALAVAGVGYGTWHRQRSLGRLALAHSEARVASLLDQGSDAVLFISRDGVIAEANARACEMFGHSHSEMVGMNAAELETLGADEGVARRLAEITGRQTAVFDTSQVRKDGSEFSGELSARVVEEAGQTWTVAVIRDVTDRRRAEAALRESEAKLTTLFEILPVGVCILDAERKISFANPALERIFGMTREGLLRGDYRSRTYLRPAGTPMPAEEFASALALEGQRAVHNVETGVVKEDGNVIWTNVSAVPVTFPDWKVVIVTTDLTERRRAEEALRQSEERYRTILQAIVEGYFEVDIRGNMTFCNESMAQLLGRTREELIGLNNRAYMDEANAARVYETFNRVYRTGEPAEGVDWELIRTDGVRIMVETSVALLRDAGRQPVGFRGLLRDITERKRAEIEREELVASVRALSAYLSTIGEELRARIARELHDRIGQNLAAMALDLDIVRSRLPAEALGAAEARLDDASRLVEQMVHDVRDLMAELRPPLLDEVGLTAALRWYGQQFAVRTGVAFQIEGGGSVPRLASGTETTVFRIAQEALANVAAHAGARRVLARFSIGKDAVVLVIEDDGCGFDMDRPVGSDVRPSWGLLGMRERAEAIGGTVRVESSVGAGTRVTIEVPR